MPAPRLLLALLLLLGVVGGLLLVDHLVVTDAEAVEALVLRAAETVRDADWEAFRALLADEYEGEGGTAEGAVRRVQRAHRSVGEAELGALRAELLDLEVEGDEAHGPVKVSASFHGRRGAISLAVGFVRQEEGWKIASARLTGAVERVPLFGD